LKRWIQVVVVVLLLLLLLPPLAQINDGIRQPS
jgi:hypothetical protein